MPIPFHDDNDAGRTDSVAWLRFVEERGDRGIHAGLFETSALGEPLGFGFVRTGLHGSVKNDALLSLASCLFRSSTTTPALLFGLADEIPSLAFEGVEFGLPFCRLRPAPPQRPSSASGDHFERMLWETRPPPPGSVAGAILGQVLDRDDPFEPLERTAKGLAQAFTDSRIRTMARISGLTNVTVLMPRSETSAAVDGLRSPDLSASGYGEEVEGGLAERIWAALAAPRSVAGASPADTHLEWPSDLMPFQREGIQALIEMDRLLLSDDMGLGKTVQAVAALRILRLRDEIDTCLVVAPASVLDQWRREIVKWAPELSAIVIRGSADDRAWQWRAAKDITLVSYDVLRSDAGIVSTLRGGRRAWDVVVLDEAQRIKNRNDTSETVKKISRRRSWALTGTPMENNEEELASIIEFVDQDEGMPRMRYHPGTALRSRHRELQLRRKKQDVLEDLPPKLQSKLTISLHATQRDSYDKAERDGIVYLKSLGAEISVRHVLELITRLKQICNVDPKSGSSSKLDDIRERLRMLTEQGHRALIFSQYTGETGVAAAASHLLEFEPLILTGDVPVGERSAIVDRFKTRVEHKALIVSLRAGGVGLNLQEASYVFHLDRWWNPAVERQAEDRSHRLGQTVKVNVIKYTCADTIEERIDQVLERKQRLFNQLVDDVSLDLSTRMNRKELLALFELG